MRGATITGNFAEIHGGGFALQGFNSVLGLFFEDCTFEQNRALLKGGAIFFNMTSNLNIDGCDFLLNSASTGGAISHELGSNTQVISINNTKFMNNSASTFYGGAISLAGPG